MSVVSKTMRVERCSQHCGGSLVCNFALEFHQDLWDQKTTVPALSCMMTSLANLLECRLVTDRQTQDHSVYHAAYMGNNN